MYIANYGSPFGNIVLSADEKGLTELSFKEIIPPEETSENEIITQTKKWLDIYFGGNAPDFTPPLNLKATDFRRRVWKILLEIPYGKTMTYGEIAAKLAAESERGRMSAQAVGGAVGHNPAAIIIPCHRVTGSDGSLTGYRWGISRKKALLDLERGSFY